MSADIACCFNLKIKMEYNANNHFEKETVSMIPIVWDIPNQGTWKTIYHIKIGNP